MGDTIDLYSTRAGGGGSNGDDPGRFFVSIRSPLDCVSLDVCKQLIGKKTIHFQGNRTRACTESWQDHGTFLQFATVAVSSQKSIQFYVLFAQSACRRYHVPLHFHVSSMKLLNTFQRNLIL